MQEDDISPARFTFGLGVNVVARQDITYGMMYPNLASDPDFISSLVAVPKGTVGHIYHKPEWFVDGKLFVGVRWPSEHPERSYEPLYVAYDWIEEVPSDDQTEH